MTCTPPPQGSSSASADRIVPTELDILCGKTKQCINHPGTLRYHRILETHTQRYDQAETKLDKMTITKSLYGFLRETSRFLKFNNKEQTWEEITPLAGRDKIGHALRFAVNNANNDKKKRSSGKHRGGHRRVGSDWSAASLTSLVSTVSTGSTTVASASSSNEPAVVQSLMQALNSSMNITAQQQASAARANPQRNNNKHPLLVGTSESHPLFGAREHPLLSSSTYAGEHPLLVGSTSDPHPLSHPLFEATASDELFEATASDDNLFLSSSTNTLHGSQRSLSSASGPPPINIQVPAVITQPAPAPAEEEYWVDGLPLSQLLHEPIYEIDDAHLNDCEYTEYP